MDYRCGCLLSDGGAARSQADRRRVERCLLILRPSAVIVLQASIQPHGAWPATMAFRLSTLSPPEPGKLGLQLAAPCISAAGLLDDRIQMTRPLFFTCQAPPSHRIWSPLVTAMRSLPQKGFKLGSLSRRMTGA